MQTLPFIAWRNIPFTLRCCDRSGKRHDEIGIIVVLLQFVRADGFTIEIFPNLDDKV